MRAAHALRRCEHVGRPKSLTKRFEKLANEAYEDFSEGDFETAEAKLNKALQLAQELGINDCRLASVLNMLGGVLRAAEQDEQALSHCVAAFKIMERECEPGDGDLIGVASNIAQIAGDLEREDEALEWSRRAYELARESSPPELAKAAMAYTDLLLEADRAAEAVDLLVTERDALLEFLSSPPNDMAMMTAPLGEMIKEEFREEHREPPMLLLLRIQLARARHALGQEDGSIAALAEMGIFEGRTNGENSPELGMQYQEVGVALHLLAQETRNRGHFAKAKEYYTRSLEILESACDDDDEHLANARENMEELEGDMQDAE